MYCPRIRCAGVGFLSEWPFYHLRRFFQNRQTRRFFERHTPYNTELWKVLRGDLYETEYFDGAKAQKCCRETGAEFRIASDRNSKSGFEYRRAEMSLRLLLQEATDTLSNKGYFDNVESEGLLRQCAGLRFF